ncbi:fatty acid-binding protein, brain-like isoform X1 [Stegostoma tigrinum]|uniref:fatty acid-binding protein, brain-like isoform X1 n=1 Tax=Stegostoma tigrinum TaxID=3053191 RepID=UPI00202B27CC|nr:fatty acid-binding protein, brain-like isoform X1 [Stegostoma tigrinum]
MERFLGTWRLVDTQNFDNYMRELGVDFATRQVGNVLKPTTIIKVDGDNVILQTKSTYRSTEIIFQLDKPFNEHTADNRDCKTVVSLEGDKLVQVQKWDGKQTTLTREIKNDHLILVTNLQWEMKKRGNYVVILNSKPSYS